MLIVSIHQAGAGQAELQQRVLLALQAMRVKYPNAQGIIGGDFNTNANGAREGYAKSNDKQLRMVDEPLQSFVQSVKGYYFLNWSLRTHHPAKKSPRTRQPGWTMY